MTFPKKIVDTNQRVITLNLDDLDVVWVNHDRLDEVFKIFDKVEITDDLQGLIKKGAYLMASIAWAQPFGGGNKRTAILITATFFHHNRAEMVIPEEDKELRKLLYDGSVKLLAYITRPKFIKSGNN